MKVEWHDYVSVGVEEIDQQHRLLFDSYNAFFTAYQEGKGDAEVIRLFFFLEGYVAAHFADEERLMLQSGFPEFGKHSRQHRELAGKVVELKDSIENEGPNPNLVSSAGLLMTGWLIEHISVQDRAIGRFLMNPDCRTPRNPA